MENTMEKLPANAQAIKDWVIANRTDIAPDIEDYLKQDFFILVVTIGFEAGRKFQFDNLNKDINDRRYLDL